MKSYFLLIVFSENQKYFAPIPANGNMKFIPEKNPKKLGKTIKINTFNFYFAI